MFRSPLAPVAAPVIALIASLGILGACSPEGTIGGEAAGGAGGAAPVGSGGVGPASGSGGTGGDVIDAGQPPDGTGGRGGAAVDAGNERGSGGRAADAAVLPGDEAHRSGGPFVGPAIASDCPDDPTAGWTEYVDTFHVEKPYDLTEAQRFSYDAGVFTFWVLPTDKAHQPGNTTDPRTEARWSDFTSKKPHLFSADMMFERPTDHSTIFQVHTTASGAGPVYLRVDTGNIHPLNGGVFASNLFDTWFNLKVALDPTTLEATIWINNCQKLKGVIGSRGNSVNYFKNGVYTCSSASCKDHYKNIHLYTK